MLHTAIYIRLSKEDGENDSIRNQKMLLYQYAERNHMEISKEYVDDGYSGTNFDRPAFKEMISDMENGLINQVLLKDLSRLGRDYIGTGQYTEIWFPSHGIRCISVCDGYDSQNNASDLIPFQNLINEMYARDISRKIRYALRCKMQNGDYIGAKTPFGYDKTVERPYKLVPNLHKAKTVRTLFDLASVGSSPSEISKIMNENGVSSPSEKPWTAHGVLRILRNPVYIGHSVQGKSRKPSFRTKYPVRVPPSECITVYRTHPPLVTEETYLKVQGYLDARRCRKSSDSATNEPIPLDFTPP